MDRCQRTAGGDLELAGWAGYPDDGHESPQVQIAVGDRVVAKIQPSVPRPDVSAAYREPRYASVGWSFVVDAAESAAVNDEITISVTAIADDGRQRLLHAEW